MQRHPGERCVGSRGRADIEEVEGLGGKQRLDLGVELGPWKTPSGLDEPRFEGISGGNDMGPLAPLPSWQMPIYRYISKTDDGAFQHILKQGIG